MRNSEMMKPTPGARTRGFTYAGVLIAVALVGLSLAATGEVWRTTVQREKERELLFVGDEIRKAITQYYESTPGTGKQFPTALEDLVRDARYPTTRRYLRKVYRDPMTGKADWGLIKGPGDGIMGVYSLSKLAPIKRANFPPDYASFQGAADYRDWQFAHGGAKDAGSQKSAPAPGLTPPASAPLPTSAVIGKTPEAPPAQAPTTMQRPLSPTP
jgi:type II secretory pathway pseudopilin PulG